MMLASSSDLESSSSSLIIGGGGENLQSFFCAPGQTNLLMVPQDCPSHCSSLHQEEGVPFVLSLCLPCLSLCGPFCSAVAVQPALCASGRMALEIGADLMYLWRQSVQGLPTSPSWTRSSEVQCLDCRKLL